MIQLGPLTLPDDMLWINEFDTPAIPQDITETLGGGVVISTLAGVTPKRSVILESTDDGDRIYGALTRFEVQTLKTLEAEGNQLALTYHNQSMVVVIVAGGVQFSPIYPHPDAKDDDLYTGILTLTEV